MNHQPSPSSKSAKYKVPFFVLLVVCVLLAVALAVVLPPDRSEASIFPSMEGEITEVLGGTLYYQTLAFRTTDGTAYYIDVRPYTEIYDAKGEPVLVSGLTPGLQVKVTYEDIVNSAEIYTADGEKAPTRFSYCPEIRILP